MIANTTRSRTMPAALARGPIPDSSDDAASHASRRRNVTCMRIGIPLTDAIRHDQRLRAARRSFRYCVCLVAVMPAPAARRVPTPSASYDSSPTGLPPDGHAADGGVDDASPMGSSSRCLALGATGGVRLRGAAPDGACTAVETHAVARRTCSGALRRNPYRSGRRSPSCPGRGCTRSRGREPATACAPGCRCQWRLLRCASVTLRGLARPAAHVCANCRYSVNSITIRMHSVECGRTSDALFAKAHQYVDLLMAKNR